jgi:hypothetical protein
VSVHESSRTLRLSALYRRNGRTAIRFGTRRLCTGRSFRRRNVGRRDRSDIWRRRIDGIHGPRKFWRRGLFDHASQRCNIAACTARARKGRTKVLPYDSQVRSDSRQEQRSCPTSGSTPAELNVLPYGRPTGSLVGQDFSPASVRYTSSPTARIKASALLRSTTPGRIW